jgi:polyisoprenoid-binding protein YceI
MALQNWNVDSTHSSVGFTVRHMVFTKVRGQFHTWSAELAVDEADLANSRVRVEIDVASIDTAEEKRDAHLRSADFFDAEQFPKMTFVSKRVSGKGERFQVLGDLTLHGVTREVTLEVTREGTGKDPWGNERVGFSASTQLNRTDYGLKWNQALETGGVLVGEKVDIAIEISAIKPKAA